MMACSRQRLSGAAQLSPRSARARRQDPVAEALQQCLRTRGVCASKARAGVRASQRCMCGHQSTRLAQPQQFCDAATAAGMSTSASLAYTVTPYSPSNRINTWSEVTPPLDTLPCRGHSAASLYVRCRLRIRLS